MASDFETTYADLLDTLPAEARRGVVSAFGNAILEGWEPSREQVELQVLDARGELSDDEFERRAREVAERIAEQRRQTAS